MDGSRAKKILELALKEKSVKQSKQSESAIVSSELFINEPPLEEDEIGAASIQVDIQTSDLKNLNNADSSEEDFSSDDSIADPDFTPDDDTDVDSETETMGLLLENSLKETPNQLDKTPNQLYETLNQLDETPNQLDETPNQLDEIVIENRRIRKLKPISITKYREIFNSTGLKFKRPQLDTCTNCDKLKLKIKANVNENELEALMLEQKLHHEEADLAYKLKKLDISQASKVLKVYTFDLQQCLPTPYLQSSVSYYKRQLNTFNLTIHNCDTRIANCYMWHEAIANRGGNEIASCLYQHIKTISPNVEKLIFWSDSCFGQNKNSHVALMFAIFTSSSSTIEIIDHKFLIPGHTHMECDIDHALIERKKKKLTIQIHHPRDWYQFVRSVGDKKPFQLFEMCQFHFKDFGNAVKTKCTFRKFSEDNEPVNWTKIKWLRYTKEFGFILFKYTLKEEEPFKKLRIQKRGFKNIKIADIEDCYKAPILINELKKKDLISLLPLVDSEYHDFYKNLNTISEPDTHPDLTECDLDD